MTSSRLYLQKLNAVFTEIQQISVVCRCGEEHVVVLSENDRWIATTHCSCGAKITTTAVANSILALPREETQEFPGERL